MNYNIAFTRSCFPTWIYRSVKTKVRLSKGHKDRESAIGILHVSLITDYVTEWFNSFKESHIYFFSCCCESRGGKKAGTVSHLHKDK